MGKKRSLREQLKILTDALRNREKDYKREMDPYQKKNQNKNKNNK